MKLIAAKHVLTANNAYLVQHFTDNISNIFFEINHFSVQFVRNAQSGNRKQAIQLALNGS